MKYYGKSKEVCEKIIQQFESGNVPAALKQVFVNRSDNIPSDKWSWNNRFIQAIHGTHDSRGFKQWQAAGRKVSKGSKALHILGPCVGKKKDLDENGKEVEVPVLFGFRSIPVFALESTEITDPDKWEKCSGIDHAEENRLQELPLREVAERWNIKVKSFSGKGGKTLGYYSHSDAIALGVENLSTWCHELVHAADHNLGTLTIAPGQQTDNEIVAELGGAVILQLLGYEAESDIGGAWDYIKTYSKNDKNKAISLCCKFIDRICNCVQAILNAHDQTEIQKAA